MQLLLLALFVVGSLGCNKICMYNYEPVCGTDGRTYSNKCQMYSIACLEGRAVAVSRSGTCEPARKMNSLPKTACNKYCTYQWEPVCGTDGKTYGNQCELDSRSCLEGRSVSVAKTGTCNPTASTFMLPKTACNKYCTYQWEPVCGTDGKTYGNQCELESKACLEGKTVAVARSGTCGPAPKMNGLPKTACIKYCTYQWEPVCGTDGQTYGNQCELDSRSCLEGRSVSVARAGTCGPEPRMIGLPKTACNKICTYEWKPVCGSDARTYGNRCQMNSVSCLEGRHVVEMRMGTCEEAPKMNGLPKVA